MDNVRRTVVSQYANSPVLLAIIDAMNAAINPAADIDGFYDLVWNVDTAQGYGLDVWGRIVGVTRVLQVVNATLFGFSEAHDPSIDSFGNAVFGGGSNTSNYTLTDNQFRTLIYAKALFNISDGSISSINRILLTLFSGRGACYVVEGGSMALVYRFRFPLTPIEYAMVQQSGVLPRPAGVSASVVQG